MLETDIAERESKEYEIDTEVLENLGKIVNPRTQARYLLENYPFSEMLAGRIFALLSEDKLRYCHQWKTWMVWNKTVWLPDTTEEVSRQARKVIAWIKKTASDVSDPILKVPITQFSLKLQKKATFQCMLDFASQEKELAMSSHLFDYCPYYLNLANGVYDLEREEMKPHNRFFYITKQISHKYDSEAKCPKWKEFLERIFAESPEMLDYVQRAVGYSASADISEQCLFILWGSGANGKSTFLEVIRRILEDYSVIAQPDTFYANSHPAPRSDLARLKGKRFLITTEFTEARHINEALIKQLTGGESITARFLYSKEFEFTPEFHIWMATNHRPRIRGGDHGIWRRIRLIPFTVSIPEGEQRKGMIDELLEETPGILRWIIDGFCAWKRYGLKPAPEIEDATTEYRQAEDVVEKFIQDVCIIAVEAKAKTSYLFGAFKEWAKENKEFCGSQTWFSDHLRAKGFEREHERSGNYWKGIGVYEK